MSRQSDFASHATHWGTEFRACLNSHGLYNSVQSVLRLSSEVHRRLATLRAGIHSSKLSLTDVRAYSTYLHETTHWWQHVGSSRMDTRVRCS
jgi:hypothetical protein